jgi:hypothetical protein
MNHNNKEVISGVFHRKSRCNCINCSYGIIDIFSNNTSSSDVKKEIETPVYKTIITGSFSKGEIIL